jgi:RNA polymerase sigma factor (sigma-70 family)
VVTEHFTRISASVIQYAATVVDPKTFQDRIELSFPMAMVDERIYEAACHEGNYSLGANSDGHAYVEMRRRLRDYFRRKNCRTADDLADETLTRVARRLEEEGITRGETPARYCYIVARFVFLEHLRESKAHPTVTHVASDVAPQPSAPSAADTAEAAATREALLACLQRCIEQLDPLNRRIITRYYIGSARVKIDNRRELAESLGLSVNALTVRACRIRTRVEACVRRCAGAG